MVMNLTKTLLKNIDNKEIISYNVRFDNGFEVEILNLGGIITKIITPDKNGNLENIVVGYKDIESYIQNPSYFGAIIGRTSGRICEGKISIDGVDYDLAKNYNPHQGHGGDKGFNSKIWDVKILEEETPKYKCDCSREKVERALLSIGYKDLKELYDEGKEEELKCHFCNKAYKFTKEDIGKLLEEKEKSIADEVSEEMKKAEEKEKEEKNKK